MKGWRHEYYVVLGFFLVFMAFFLIIVAVLVYKLKKNKVSELNSFEWISTLKLVNTL